MSDTWFINVCVIPTNSIYPPNQLSSYYVAIASNLATGGTKKGNMYSRIF